MPNRVRVRNLAGFAVLGFVLMLGWALYKLLDLQSEISTDVGENMVWAISQSIYQSTQLAHVARVAPVTPESQAEHDLHLDLLKSSVQMLNQGPQLRYMQRSGVDKDIQQILARLEQVPIAYTEITRALRMVSNSVMLAEREDAGLRRDANRHLIFQVIATVVGILLAGALLCWQMLMSLRMATRAKEELQIQHVQTQRLLEVLQQERLVRLRYRDFVSLMSHQLRTPLAVIDSTAQRLKRQLSEPVSEVSLEERSQRIRSSVNHLNHLIGRVLEGLRLDEGVSSSESERRLELQVHDWGRLVASALERFGDLLNERPVRLNWPEGTTGLQVECDQTWTIEILCNLISNAHKYSPPGRAIEITMSLREEVFECVVRDHGCGVEEAEAELIFERFYRAGNNPNVVGIGLGLPIARTLAEWHGGTLTVVNAADGGAMFTLTLPQNKHCSKAE
ncbi:sensor histidine kinase [Pseudomonas sp. TTU2014-080ASC]|uniref:sensor histidine kinase n=1 Tax=Pseudomonas sp. TTU2014-080ASC TaxID=1729724 RepID=UPI0007185DD5|nr:HAMP domain-containing sensor histidine kinase [Pseudomonas sp. TTU2014-080ASC]KRW61333.1 hypothetical protein AO726_08385 [Pseudomonas sp. TTU2014-080ASC]